jgi:SAM-dependent methyltransferase
MFEASRHDAWQAGDSYDQYMGRWSRLIAPRFLEWLSVPDNLDWLEVGCGTGALSAAVIARCAPRSLLAIDPSEDLLAKARMNIPDTCAEFQLGDAQALPVASGSKDAIVSALVLNFVPEPERALAEMKRAVRVGGTIGFYVWDYPGGGLEFLHAFWTVAAALDPNASDLSEDKRFPMCTPEGLRNLARKAGLVSTECVVIEVPTLFKSFEDFWHPFTLGAGPAPGYYSALAPEVQQHLREAIHESLPQQGDGSIHLKAHAWAVRATIE